MSYFPVVISHILAITAALLIPCSKDEYRGKAEMCVLPYRTQNRKQPLYVWMQAVGRICLRKIDKMSLYCKDAVTLGVNS